MNLLFGEIRTIELTVGVEATSIFMMPIGTQQLIEIEEKAAMDPETMKMLPFLTAFLKLTLLNEPKNVLTGPSLGNISIC